MHRKLTRDELRYELRHQAYVETDEGTIALIEDPMIHLKPCAQFMQRVLSGHYELDATKAARQQQNIHREELRQVLEDLPCYSEVYRPGWVYEPSIALFLEQYRKHPIAHVQVSRLTYEMPDGRTAEQTLVDFIGVLRAEAVAQGTRKKIADHKNKLAKNDVRVTKFEKELFRRVSRVVIVRDDLEYRANRFACEDPNKLANELAILAGREQLQHSAMYMEDEPTQGRPVPPMRVDLETVQRDRIKFFACMKGKPSLFRHLVGYVWRIEYGHHTGFHLHVLLAFHGAHVRKHEDLAQRIGLYWENEITSGRGRFHNCNRDWNPSAHTYGLGPIEWHETRVRSNLVNHVLKYLVKPDQYVLARPYKGMKLMGSGFVHRDKPTRGGRPRSRTPRAPKPPRPQKRTHIRSRNLH